jgi:hypothetical protein
MAELMADSSDEEDAPVPDNNDDDDAQAESDEAEQPPPPRKRAKLTSRVDDDFEEGETEQEAPDPPPKVSLSSLFFLSQFFTFFHLDSKNSFGNSRRVRCAGGTSQTQGLASHPSSSDVCSYSPSARGENSLETYRRHHQSAQGFAHA